MLLPSWNDIGNEFAPPRVDGDRPAGLLLNTERVTGAYAATLGMRTGVGKPDGGADIKWDIDEFESILGSFLTLI